MKPISKRLCIMVVPTMVCLISSPALGLCRSKAECVAKMTSGCCCPSGETEPIYSCPSGWAANSSGICMRSSNKSASDLKGYYTATYGTCDATQTGTMECWIMMLTSTGPECMCNATDDTPVLKQ